MRHINNYLIDLEKQQKSDDSIFSASVVKEITNLICGWFNTYCDDLNIFKSIPNEESVHKSLHNQQKLNKAKAADELTTKREEEEEDASSDLMSSDGEEEEEEEEKEEES
jgi:hypothetical protein